MLYLKKGSQYYIYYCFFKFPVQIDQFPSENSIFKSHSNRRYYDVCLYSCYKNVFGVLLHQEPLESAEKETEVHRAAKNPETQYGGGCCAISRGWLNRSHGLDTAWFKDTVVNGYPLVVGVRGGCI